MVCILIVGFLQTKKLYSSNMQYRKRNMSNGDITRGLTKGFLNHRRYLEQFLGFWFNCPPRIVRLRECDLT